MTDATNPLSGERADLLEALRTHRQFLRFTTQGLTDEQARQQTSASTLCVGGLIKHVAATEAEWARFAVHGPAELNWQPEDENAEDWASGMNAEVVEAYLNGFRLGPDETLAGVLADYDEVARRTDELVAVIDLDSSHPLPAAPWFEPGATRTARRVFLHIVAETAQHAGHADIIREGIDGQKTMG